MDDPDSPAGIIEYLKSRNAIRTGIYHLVSLPLIIFTILTQKMADGPRNPGLAFVVILYVFFADAVLILVSLFRRIILGKQHVTPLFINLIALAIVILICALRSGF